MVVLNRFLVPILLKIYNTPYAMFLKYKKVTKLRPSVCPGLALFQKFIKMNFHENKAGDLFIIFKGNSFVSND